MVDIDKPWRIREEEGGYTCARLGCRTDKLVSVQSPHSALQIMVCPPCRWARKRWDEMNKSGVSKSYNYALPS